MKKPLFRTRTTTSDVSQTKNTTGTTRTAIGYVRITTGTSGTLPVVLTRMLATCLAFTILATGLTACRGNKAGGSGGLMTLDVRQAIGTEKHFDLTEIASGIEFIPLDNISDEALLNRIVELEESENRFYIRDGWNSPVKVFDKTGKFISYRGVIGRGPDEFLAFSEIAVDHENDYIYLGGQNNATRAGAMIVYDSDGNISARNDSIDQYRMSYHKGRLVVAKRSGSKSDGNLFDPNAKPKPDPGFKATLLETYSPDLQPTGKIEVTDKGPSYRLMTEDEQGMYITIIYVSSTILSDNGKSLLVKEALNDTVFHFMDNMTLEPAFRLDLGNLATPAEAYGNNPTVELDGSSSISGIYEGDRYLFVSVTSFGKSSDIKLIFDKRTPEEGFSTVGPDGKYGLHIDGIKFTPCYIRDNKLVGFLSALDIADGRDDMTDPDLKAAVAGIVEESNPVLAVVELK